VTPATNKGLASTLADGIKSAFVRCSSVVPGGTFIVHLLYLSSVLGSLLG
jgi:hypothetical protein